MASPQVDALSSSPLHPLVESWFVRRFGEPTDAQRLGWPSIAAGRPTLIAAPTGSGKTLAAFLVCLDRLVRQWLDGQLRDEIQVVYISPLKALSNDIHRNLEVPLAELAAMALEQGYGELPIRAAVRTGDTLPAERQAMLRRPPHILVTTPESLYILLTSKKGCQRLRSVRTVIVDEIHALARDKRGSHLALSLERLDALCDGRPTRIGLSATQRPIDQIAQFLVGGSCSVPCAGEGPLGEGPPLPHDASTEPAGSEGDRHANDRAARDRRSDVTIVDAGHVRRLDVGIELPPSELSAVCSHEQWDEIYARLVELIQSHRSTLVFVNTRRLAERVAHALAELLGDDAVASHHGSLSREIRHAAEQRLKAGTLRAIVATASLEMGIDIGYIDLVCQIGSPRSIATFLQRVGRSGHSLGLVPKGRLFPLTRDELVECLALVRSVRDGHLDQIEIPVAPLDILAQQIVAAVAAGTPAAGTSAADGFGQAASGPSASRPTESDEPPSATADDAWSEDDLFALCRRAWPYRNLARADFDAIVGMLSEGVAPGVRRGAHLHRDALRGQLRPRRGARLAAITSGGAIPETAQYRVVTEDEGLYVGTLDEDFAIESTAGDVFLLGNTSWRIVYVRGGEVVVRDARGAPPSVPFWIGEGPGRTIELSAEVSRLRADVAERIVRRGDSASADPSLSAGPEVALAADQPSVAAWLAAECGVDESAAAQAVHYIAAQQAAIGLVPTVQRIVFERFFDESGGMQLVIHAPLGARINRAWGLAMRKRFCRSFDFELQASADDNGVVLSVGPQHSFPIDSLFKMLNPQNGEYLLEQALLAAPMFQTRWRWNVTRALAVLRHQGGRKVPPYLQRFRSDDLLAQVFPGVAGCLENHHGDMEIPDHPLVRQTIHDCMTEAMDLRRWLGVLEDVVAGRVELVARDTREPSPFAYELINANPYAFLDGAPLEERRTRAVATRRTFSIDDVSDLGRLDPAAVEQVRADAWPVVRDAEELLDALKSLVLVTGEDAESWRPWLAKLVADGRAVRLVRPSGGSQGEQGDSNSAELSREPSSPSGPATLDDAQIDHAAALWLAAERWPVVRALFDAAACDPPLVLPPHLDRPVERTAALVELIRGRIQHIGPVTAAELARQFHQEESAVFASLEAIEAGGTVLRGRFTTSPPASGQGGPTASAGRDLQWCDRRLLARIHRLTLDGLRRRIKPVEPVDLLRFLVRRHRLLPGSQYGGPAGVREAIGMLQGYEAPAAAWESRLIAPRVAEYDAASLDELFLSGELMWSRLRPPRRDAEATAIAAMTRAVPISLFARDDLEWLLPDDIASERAIGSSAQRVRDVLRARGALFFGELVRLTQLLPGHLEQALRELAAWGLVTADSFAAIRALGESKQNRRPKRPRAGRAASGTAPAGRWSLLPDSVERPDRPAYLYAWCRQLLRRWGVVFRDLLAREVAAPNWGELVPVFRQMERRGEIRGGRFASGVAGEQFADENAVRWLREVRDEPPDEPWIVLSAADPLNLTGILESQSRVPATHGGTLILQAGRWVAVRHGGRIEFFEPLEPAVQAEMTRALYLGRRKPSEEIDRPAARWPIGAGRSQSDGRSGGSNGSVPRRGGDEPRRR